jgi:DNA adenine methylase
MVKPILKWAGGKRKLLPDIIGLFPRDYGGRRYHEPFFGGGAVFFQINPREGSINDINPKLVNFYKVVRDQPGELIDQAKEYNYEEEEYYTLRDRFNEPDLPKVEEAALLLYLNRTGFNGLYRVNSKGEFNVPFGRYSNPTIVLEKRIRKARKVLRNMEIFNKDFSYILEYANPGDLVYFDPPYQPVSDTANFTNYSPEGFDLDEQVRLREICEGLDDKGVLFVLSNSHAKPIRELYHGTSFRVERVKANRVISSKASTRGRVAEILVTNIPEIKILSQKTLKEGIE